MALLFCKLVWLLKKQVYDRSVLCFCIWEWCHPYFNIIIFGNKCQLPAINAWCVCSLCKCVNIGSILYSDAHFLHWQIWSSDFTVVSSRQWNKNLRLCGVIKKWNSFYSLQICNYPSPCSNSKRLNLIITIMLEMSIFFLTLHHIYYYSVGLFHKIGLIFVQLVQFSVF